MTIQSKLKGNRQTVKHILVTVTLTVCWSEASWNQSHWRDSAIILTESEQLKNLFCNVVIAEAIPPTSYNNGVDDIYLYTHTCYREQHNREDKKCILYEYISNTQNII